MALLSCSNLKLSFGDRILLDGVNFTLSDGEHVGLIGRNGCGKSTLMKLAAGLEMLKPDDGQMQVAREAVVGYLTQDPQLDPDKTLIEEAGESFARLRALHLELDRLSHEMGEAQGAELDRLLARYSDLEREMHVAGGYAVEHEIEAALHGVGLDDRFFNVKVSDLSGGQKGRLSLAKLLLSKPDLLLLDEPTNHLDITGRQWLEGYLHDYPGGIMIVSHDRWLLDRVVSKIYELDRGRLFEYPGNYAQYVEIRNQRRIAQAREFDKQQDKIQREQAFIDRYRAGQRAKQARGRETRLERFMDGDLIERPMELDAMNIRLTPHARASDIVLTVESLSKSYEGKKLFEDLSIILKRGERLGIIGPNGAGKSTLIRCMLGEQPADAGTARLGASIDVGYFRQSHENLDLSLTVVDYLRKFVPSDTAQEARDLAGAFLFSGQSQEKPMSVLSGGERSRAVLAGLMAGGHNVLVLDEPTNHLDLSSAERLEEILKQFTAPLENTYSSKESGKSSGGGTLILITHDRALLNSLVDQLLVLDGHGGAKLIAGNYSEYIAQEAKASSAAAAQAAKKNEKVVKKEPPKPQSKPAPARQGNGPHARMKQDKLEARIEELTRGLKEIDETLADPQVYRDGGKVKSLQDRRDAVAAELVPLEEEWMRRADAAE